jgi:hypothetical protein
MPLYDWLASLPSHGVVGGASKSVDDDDDDRDGDAVPRATVIWAAP